MECLIVMVWLSAYYSKCPIQLLNKEQAHHFVWKCHVRQWNKLVCTVIYISRKSIWASDYECKPLRQRQHFFFYKCGKLSWSETMSFFVEQHNVVGISYTLQHGLPLKFFLPLFWNAFWVLYVGNYGCFKRYVVAQPVGVNFYTLLKVCSGSFSYGHKLYFHGVVSIFASINLSGLFFCFLCGTGGSCGSDAETESEGMVFVESVLFLFWKSEAGKIPVGLCMA